MPQFNINPKLDELLNTKFETEVIEFKEAKNDFSFEELGKYFSALSNEANLHNVECAWLVFGVEDKKHKIVGTNYRLDDKSLNSLKEEIALVDKILEAKKMLNQVQHDSSFVNTTDLEKQIDQKVYELYGLTPEEIAVVEGK